MHEHIVAVYPNDVTADAAERELRNAGIPADAVRRHRRNGSHDVLADQPGETAEPSGFWAWLLGEETPSTTGRMDSDVFERRVSAGDTVLSVTIVDDSQIHRAVEILESHKPIEIDEHTDEDDAGATQPVASAQSYRTPGVTRRPPLRTNNGRKSSRLTRRNSRLASGRSIAAPRAFDVTWSRLPLNARLRCMENA